jgi:predicted dehydrogenase
MSRRTNRRQFLGQSALAGVGFWVAGGVQSAPSKSPNEQIHLACIGAGGKGDSDSNEAGRHGTIVALCDVDDRHLDAKAKQFPRAKRYRDFRQMLDECGKYIDAVTVSTPDHTHAVAAMMAIKMGKHVYCQKPLTHTVWEARQLREAARQHKVVTQMGNQGSASDGLRRSVELVQAGLIGPVREVHVWTDRPIWRQAPKITARPSHPDPVPPYLDWDLWLGPSPSRPYVGHRTYHPWSWRGWWDFGTGALGDMACHTANLPFRAVRLGAPTSVHAESGPINPETYPAWARIVYEFPARGDLPPVKLTWYEGHKDGKVVQPPAELLQGQHFSASGSLMVGAKGSLYSPDDYGERRILLPAGKFKDEGGPPRKLPRNGRDDEGMKIEWIKAIRAQDPRIAYSNFDFAATLTEAMLLGNVALRVGQGLEWDSANLRASNCPEAEQYIRPPYRAGWHL